MSFDPAQVKALSDKLNAKHVKMRCASDGALLSYIEGWHAIAEANRIFGFDAWDRQTIATKCVWQGAFRQSQACSYVAQVRITVRAGEVVICREASGCGHGAGPTAGEAHESAIKEAETDATKRALVTFGNAFGLALYDPQQRAVRGVPRLERNPSAFSWVVISAQGEMVESHNDPVAFCAAVRRQLQDMRDPHALEAFWTRNGAALEMLRQNFPSLRSEGKSHYADLLASLYARRLEAARANGGAPAEASAGNGSTGSPQDTAIELARHKRIRNKEYRRFVASLPCLVCGRAPSHAHHIRFAEPRALGLKVGDDWVVPLCYTHHRSVHQVGREQDWWQTKGINPLAEAERLWQARLQATN
jgi:DNA recombination protein Rad52